MERNTFIFNTNRCVGCMACVAGCSIENGTLTDYNWRVVNGFNNLRHPSLPVFHLSLACNHCLDAPCMKNCPALAYTRDEKTGAIIHHAEACIGCKYCTWACPYDAPKYHPAKGIVEKCTFCVERIEAGQNPACTDACPVAALEFGSEEHIDEEILVPGFINKDIRPSIHIVPLRERSRLSGLEEADITYRDGLSSPEIWNIDTSLAASSESLKNMHKPKSKVNIGTDWVLMIFSLTVASMVGWMAAHITSSVRLEFEWFLLAGIFAMLLSSFHLGKKLRAWRSILNIRRSWLSREICSIIGFIGFGALFLIFKSTFLASLTALFGIFSLLSIDMLYHVLEREEGTRIHSAMTISTGILVYSVLAPNFFLFGFVLCLKLGLYLYRKIIYIRRKKYWSPLPSILRISCLILPVFYWQLILFPAVWNLAVILMIGEIIDRIEFYEEAEVPAPDRELYEEFKIKRK